MPERFRFPVVAILTLATVVALGWFMQRSGDSTTTSERRATERAGSRSESRGDPSSRNSQRHAQNQFAIISELVAAVSGEGDLGPRLISLNELAALKNRAAGPAIAGIANDAALPVRVRRQALLLLAGKPGALSRDTMVSMFQSKEKGLRLAAAQGLGILGQAEGFTALNEAFLVEQSTGVAKAIVQSMARIGSPESVEALIFHSTPANLPNDMNRDAVLGALAGITNPEAVPALTAALVSAPDAESRRAIVSSLARVADATSFGIFLKIAQTDPDHETRCHAVQGLGMIRDPLALETLRTIEASTDNTRVRSYARTAIQRIEER